MAEKYVINISDGGSFTTDDHGACAAFAMRHLAELIECPDSSPSIRARCAAALLAYAQNAISKTNSAQSADFSPAKIKSLVDVLESELARRATPAIPPV